jgi:cell filamentation protein
MFCYPGHIESEAKKLFGRRAQDILLRELSTNEFAEKSAQFLADLNAIHAFREGNGRTQLSFFLLLTDQAGHSIELEKIDPGAFLDAMIASFKGDEEPLRLLVEPLIADE